MARPDDMPVPTSPAPSPPPRPTQPVHVRIGRPPRLSRRQRLVRVLNQGGRYLVAYAITGWSCFWLAAVHLLVPGLAIAAMLANPWRPKSSRGTAAVGRTVPARPARVHSGAVLADDSLAAPPWSGARGLPSGVPPRT
jgi:hypothetical protein